jgi:hypothetical protein
MSKAKTESKERAVVVFTDKKGVFFGYTSQPTKGVDAITLERARMCVYWSAQTHGAIGLAAIGPASGSRVGPAAPSIELRGITAVVDCTPEAAAKWEAAPWA